MLASALGDFRRLHLGRFFFSSLQAIVPTAMEMGYISLYAVCGDIEN